MQYFGNQKYIEIKSNGFELLGPNAYSVNCSRKSANFFFLRRWCVNLEGLVPECEELERLPLPVHGLYDGRGQHILRLQVVRWGVRLTYHPLSMSYYSVFFLTSYLHIYYLNRHPYRARIFLLMFW